MNPALNQFCEDVVRSLGRPCASGVFGSETASEYDVFFIDEGNHLIISRVKIESFARAARGSCKARLPGRHVFLLDVHKFLLFQLEGPLLHLLYYPSIEFLKAWELPSFTAYLFESGRFISGSNESLRAPHRRYRDGSEFHFPMIEYHLARYSQLAVTFYLYERMNLENCLTRLEIFQKIAYAHRFTAVQLAYLVKPNLRRCVISDWSSILRVLRDRQPEFATARNGIAEIIRHRRERSLPTAASIKRLFSAYAATHNRCIRLLRRSRVDVELKSTVEKYQKNE